MKADLTFEIVAEIRKGSNSVEMHRSITCLGAIYNAAPFESYRPFSLFILFTRIY